jgi:hypothetical protein
MAGLKMPLLALACSTWGRTVDKAAVRWSRVVVSVCSAGVSDREVDELHSSPIFFEGHDQGGVFLGLLRELEIAAEVSAKADLEDDNGALFLVEVGRV